MLRTCRVFWRALVMVCCLASAGELALADVLVLQSGGRIEGTLLGPKQSPRDKYVIETASGGKLTFDKSQVKEVIGQSDSEEKYEKARRDYPDTVEGQMAMAGWCREHNLPRQREQHLARVLELDANHAEAHRLLGHMRVDGFWKDQRQFFEDQGFVQYQGQWMTPQEMELKEAARKTELAEKEWKRKLKTWRGWLDGPRAAEAVEQINRIGDPFATRALTEALPNEKDERYRKLYVEALARIDAPAAWRTLCERSISDPVEEIRLTCLDYLTERPATAYTDYFITRLKDKENVAVNRAALALGKLKDRKAIVPLIEALRTSHIHVVQPAQQGSTYGFGGMSGGAMSGFGGSFGSSGPKVVKLEYRNEDVLQALVNLTNQNYDYEKDAWKVWYASQRKSIGLNARRDGQ
ncbi:MAG TPA: hypothetical protein VFI31_04260 [Pirellulales bacterium]|nr:hypothetical protein [Pirellulales bacterium]